jgi:TolB protein
LFPFSITRFKIIFLGAAIMFGMAAACSIPLGISATPTFFPTSIGSVAPPPSPSPATVLLTATPSQGNDGPAGKIAFACQIFGQSRRDQICLINADASNFNRLTVDDFSEHYYPSLAPDGNSIVFSSNQSGNYEIYEMDLQGNQHQLTNGIGILTAPEISPDGSLIAFANGDGVQNISLWMMNRDGSNPHRVYYLGWDPTWSPDGKRILFASTINQSNQLFTINLDGTDLYQVTNIEKLRGRSDWSSDGSWIVTYAGKPWERELFMLAPDGSNLHQISASGGNSQGPSFSPDGKWVAFTAYFGNIGVDDGCEIYIMRVDGSQLTRLTNNAYCDWQPRWGP